MGGAKTKGRQGAARSRSLANEQQEAAMYAGRIFLREITRRLNPDELSLIYHAVYPKAVPTNDDLILQQGSVMQPEIVAAQLGDDMVVTYSYLTGPRIRFPDAGKRPHNFYGDLTRHLWDTAYRLRLMGLPVHLRQLALVHSLPEHKARGIDEGRVVVDALKPCLDNKATESLTNLTDWDGILLDHLQYIVERNGISGKSEASRETTTLKHQLKTISTGAQRHIEQTLDEVVKLAPSSPKRMVPIEVATDGIFPEVRARLHRAYIENLQTGEIERGITRPGYDYGPLVVKGLCLIDRLRTVADLPQIEKVTRESLDFIPSVDAAIAEVQKRGQFNNILTFVTQALKTELITELETRAMWYTFNRDTRFAPVVMLLNERLRKAKGLYGDAARQMGYKEGQNAFLLDLRNPSRLRDKV